MNNKILVMTCIMYISSVFFLKCGVTVVFLNTLENDGDEMNILVLERSKSIIFLV